MVKINKNKKLCRNIFGTERVNHENLRFMFFTISINETSFNVVLSIKISGLFVLNN